MLKVVYECGNFYCKFTVPRQITAVYFIPVSFNLAISCQTLISDDFEEVANFIMKLRPFRMSLYKFDYCCSYLLLLLIYYYYYYLVCFIFRQK